MVDDGRALDLKKPKNRSEFENVKEIVRGVGETDVGGTSVSTCTSISLSKPIMLTDLTDCIYTQRYRLWNALEHI
jgi:hypothetical protein